MADDLIQCPSCGFQLRLPAEYYGQTVQCPQCHAQFTAPAPAAQPAGVRPPPGREYDATPRPYSGDLPNASNRARAASAVKAPAIIMIVLSVFMTLASVYGAATAENSIKEMKELEQNKDLPQEWRDFIKNYNEIMTPRLIVGTNLAAGVLSLIILFGSIQMLRLKMRWLAILAMILGLIPVGACCCVQTPIAIWGLIVLMRGDVRDAFV